MLGIAIHNFLQWWKSPGNLISDQNSKDKIITLKHKHLIIELKVTLTLFWLVVPNPHSRGARDWFRPQRIPWASKTFLEWRCFSSVRRTSHGRSAYSQLWDSEKPTTNRRCSFSFIFTGSSTAGEELSHFDLSNSGPRQKGRHLSGYGTILSPQAVGLPEERKFFNLLEKSCLVMGLAQCRKTTKIFFRS